MKVDIEKLGELVICDVCSTIDFLNDSKKLEEVCLNALNKGHCNVIEDKVMFHKFKDDNKHLGGGITGLIIIKESHFHISTWPEEHYVQIDINTCGDTARPMIALGYLLYALKAKKVSIEMKERGRLI